MVIRGSHPLSFLWLIFRETKVLQPLLDLLLLLSLVLPQIFWRIFLLLFLLFMTLFYYLLVDYLTGWQQILLVCFSFRSILVEFLNQLLILSRFLFLVPLLLKILRFLADILEEALWVTQLLLNNRAKHISRRLLVVTFADAIVALFDVLRLHTLASSHLFI